MQAEKDKEDHTSEVMNQNDLRLNSMAAASESQQQQEPPQKCPRCESFNTKFCYYNNYSLAQPRYFCKTCRRYWTHGGTLRNVPVGGGCRKGKRAKVASSTSGENSADLQQQHQQAHDQNWTNPPSTTIISSAMRTIADHKYYPGSGYLSSLAGIHSLNQSQPFNQALNDQLVELNNGPSNMSLLQFNAQQQQCQIQPSQTHPFYQSEPNLMQTVRRISTTTVASPSSSSQLEWPQNFMNISSVANATASSEIALRSIDNPNAPTNIGSPRGSSFNQNQWPDLPGRCPPP